MRISQEEREGDPGLAERLLRSTVAGFGLVAMGTAFVLEANGFSRPVSATMLFSGVVLFSSGISIALRGGRGEVSRRDARQAEWYGRLGAMPLAALLVAIFVGRDIWALASGEGSYSVIFVLVAAALMGGSFGELVLFRLRPLLDEELTRAYALSATSWGFVAVFLGLAGVLALMMLDLKLAVMAIMPMMALAVWVAGLRLFWLMRDADED